jgi:hypothetical protein
MWCTDCLTNGVSRPTRYSDTEYVSEVMQFTFGLSVCLSCEYLIVDIT